MIMNKLRTFEPEMWLKKKEHEPQSKLTGSYKKACTGI